MSVGTLRYDATLAFLMGLFPVASLVSCRSRNHEPANAVQAAATMTSPQTRSSDPPSASQRQAPVVGESDSVSRLRGEANRRRDCLRSPISPSDEELPRLLSFNHHSTGERNERHLFVPEGPSHFDVRQIDAVVERLRSQFPKVGPISVRHCEGTPRRKSLCAHLEVEICEPWLTEAERLLGALPQGLGLLVEIVGRLGPRCVGETCLPIPYHEGTLPRQDQLWSGWFTLPYRPTDVRVPLLPELGKGVCGGDGDCEVTGCGNHCEGWAEIPHGATCPAYTELQDAHCGCVARSCTWFVQATRIAVEANVTVEGWPASGEDSARQEQSGEDIVREVLQGPWFRRQLERLKHEQGATLPRTFVLDAALDHRFRVVRSKVELSGKPAPRWLEEIVEHLPIPAPETPSKHAFRTRVSIKAEVSLSSAAE